MGLGTVEVPGRVQRDPGRVCQQARGAPCIATGWAPVPCMQLAHAVQETGWGEGCRGGCWHALCMQSAVP